MKLANQAVLAAFIVAMLNALSNAAPLPSFRHTEVSKYTPHAAKDLPTQLLPLGLSLNAWIRSDFLNNGHGCAHGPSGCSESDKPDPGNPHPLDTDVHKRAPASQRHTPIEDCAQSPTGCQGNGAPTDATRHTAGEIGEGKPFLGGGCGHSPTGCAPALPSDPDVGTREEHFSTGDDHQKPSFCSEPGGCAPPPGGGTHGKKRDITPLEEQTSELAARGKGNGGCAHSPTGCKPPDGGHPPHPGHINEKAIPVDSVVVQKRAIIAGAMNALTARGKGNGGCGHSPTGCKPPDGGHPSHPIHVKEETSKVQEVQVQEPATAAMEALAARGKGNGGCAHSPTGCKPPDDGHPSHSVQGKAELQDVDEAQVQKRALAANEAALAARGKGPGGCAHSPTGCKPPSDGGHPQQPSHPEMKTTDLDGAKVQEDATATDAAPNALAARGKGQGGCAHSPTGCGPPSHGGGPAQPSHPEAHKRDIVEEEQTLTTSLRTPTRLKPGRSCGHSPTGCPRPPPGNGGPNPGHGNGGPNPGHGKREVVDTEAHAPALATRGRSRGGCGLSPTGCIAPPNGGPHVGLKQRGEEVVEAAAESAALAARGTAKGNCNHSPTGCPPGGGGPHGQK